MGITNFIRESNAIEGIHRAPTALEVGSFRIFMEMPQLTFDDVLVLQAVFAPAKPLRSEPYMNVRVGNHIAPPGGAAIPLRLKEIIAEANTGDNPWQTHVNFETLHPFLVGNGRTGRAIWAWHMQRLGRYPFALGFLHRFYYQTLENSPVRVPATTEEKE